MERKSWVALSMKDLVLLSIGLDRCAPGCPKDLRARRKRLDALLAVHWARLREEGEAVLWEK